MRYENKTNYPINAYSAFSSSGIYYPDTSLRFSNRGFISIEGQSFFNYPYQLPFEELFSRLRSDTLSIFIFSSDTLNTFSWEEIQKDYKILKRYDISLQDLIDLDYLITYPSNERMKNIKMFPPYGTAAPLYEKPE